MFFTLCFLMFPFDAPENIKKLLVFLWFQGDEKGTLRKKCFNVNLGLNKTFKNTLSIFDNWRTSRTYVRLLLLAYAWFRTCVRWHVRSFIPYDFLKFSIFFSSYNFILFKNLLLYIWSLIFCLPLEETDSLLLSFVLKKPYFSVFHKIFNKYFSLP